MSDLRRVRALIGPRATGWGLNNPLHQALARYWDVPGIELTYQFSKTIEDGREKTRRAVEEGVDTVLVVGGDGMVNSIGSALMGTGVALGVIPTGSGNGFARHFDIPLDPPKACLALADGKRQVIDVGTVNKRPFFVTCSLAWDAALVRTFDKFPVRGVLPYVLAAATEFMAYQPQPFRVVYDDGETAEFSNVLVFTAANLTQYGGGAQIAPKACPDDGMLELVVISQKDAPRLLANVSRLFDGTFDALPGVYTRSFRRLEVRRTRAAPVQIDGELLEEPENVTLDVLPKAITVLVPR